MIATAPAPSSSLDLSPDGPPLNVGIVGFGRIGAEHAGWLSQAKGIRAVAIADTTPARRQLAAARGLDVYDTFEAMLDDRRIEAILVSLPTAMHHAHASRALAAGKHVMVEKPLALNLAESRDLHEAANRAGRVLSVFHNRRWDLDVLTVRRAFDEGVFGRITNIESRLGQWGSCVGPAAKEWRPQWRNEAAFGGGGLYDWGSHLLDQLWRLMLPAKPLRVFAQLRGNVWTSDCDDFARVLVDFDNDALGLVEINTTTARPLPRWHIDGVAGSAFSPHSSEYDTSVWASLRFTEAGADRHRTLSPGGPGLTETQIWEHFAAATRGNGPPAVTIESVLPTMALLDAARESSRTGMAVNVRATVR